METNCIKSNLLVVGSNNVGELLLKAEHVSIECTDGFVNLWLSGKGSGLVKIVNPSNEIIMAATKFITSNKRG